MKRSRKTKKQQPPVAQVSIPAAEEATPVLSPLEDVPDRQPGPRARPRDPGTGRFVRRPAP